MNRKNEPTKLSIGVFCSLWVSIPTKGETKCNESVIILCKYYYAGGRRRAFELSYGNIHIKKMALCVLAFDAPRLYTPLCSAFS